MSYGNGSNVPFPELPKIKAVCIQWWRAKRLIMETKSDGTNPYAEMRSQVITIDDYPILFARFDAL